MQMLKDLLILRVKSSGLDKRGEGQMKLAELLTRYRTTILDKWFHLIINSYPKETSRFLDLQKNPFANPVGSTIKTCTTAALDLLTDPTGDIVTADCLEGLIKIRAVQTFSPSRALAFIPELNSLLEEILGNELTSPRYSSELASLRRRIEKLTLAAFDIYMSCIEKLYQIRADEIKRSHHTMLKRLEKLDNERKANPNEVTEL